jgi:hypothetical protein
MGIYAQPNSWQCGPFALKHGLLALGIHAHEDQLTRIASSSETNGTDEYQLARAAHAHGCTLSVVRRFHAAAAQQELDHWFARGIPVLLCLDQWEHWVTALAADREHVVVLDSQFDNAVLRVETRDRVGERLAYHKRRWRGMWTQQIYDLYPLVPLRETGIHLRLTPERARGLLLHEGGAFADRWDEYARRLLPLVAAAGPTEHLMRLDRFLVSQADRIRAEVARTRGTFLRPEGERVLQRLALAAELYEYRLRPILMRRAVARAAGVVSGLIPAKPARAVRRQAARQAGAAAASA